MSQYEIYHGSPGRIIGNLQGRQLDVYHRIRKEQLRNNLTEGRHNSELLRAAFNEALKVKP